MDEVLKEESAKVRAEVVSQFIRIAKVNTTHKLSVRAHTLTKELSTRIDTKQMYV